jgi:hypothetical protein
MDRADCAVARVIKVHHDFLIADFDSAQLRPITTHIEGISMSTVKPIPKGYRSITPCLHVKGATKALDFYGKAFGATERMRMDMPDGTIGHAEIQIGAFRPHAGGPPARRIGSPQGWRTPTRWLRFFCR